jgi:nucleoside-diphosphate-sugar epimerase
MDPHSPYSLVVPIFIQTLLEGGRPTIHGNGSQSRDFTYVDDTVRATIAAATAPESAFGGVFNVGGGRTPTSVRQLLDVIATELGVTADPVFAPSRPADMLRTEADLTLAGMALGYRPRVDLQEGIRRTVEWFVSHRQPAALAAGE